MDNKTKFKIVSYIVLILGIFTAGFFIGRKTIDVGEPEIIYMPGDTVTVTVTDLVPVNEKVDTANIINDCVKNGLFYELFPEKVKDSIIYLTLTKEDTAKIFNDWATERIYNVPLFSIDTIGSASLTAKVQYNRLYDVNATFVPVVKQITQPKKVKKYSPFIGGGITTFPTVSLQGGVFAEDKYPQLTHYYFLFLCFPA